MRNEAIKSGTSESTVATPLVLPDGFIRMFYGRKADANHRRIISALGLEVGTRLQTLADSNLTRSQVAKQLGLPYAWISRLARAYNTDIAGGQVKNSIPDMPEIVRESPQYFSFTDREKFILDSRQGFDASSKTLEEIASELKITGERVRQIHQKTIRKLKRRKEIVFTRI